MYSQMSQDQIISLFAFAIVTSSDDFVCMPQTSTGQSRTREMLFADERSERDFVIVDKLTNQEPLPHNFRSHAQSVRAEIENGVAQRGPTSIAHLWNTSPPRDLTNRKARRVEVILGDVEANGVCCDFTTTPHSGVVVTLTTRDGAVGANKKTCISLFPENWFCTFPF